MTEPVLPEAVHHPSPPSAASRPNTQRAMILYAAAVALGLALAGYEVLTARGTATRTVPPENIATVNLQPILRSDFVTQTESETGDRFEQVSRADKLRVLDKMISEELKVQRGLELNFAETDQDTRNALANIVDQQMLAEIATGQPSEQELQDYYEANKAKYHSPGQMTVCDLVASGEPAGQAQRASDAAAALRAHARLAMVLLRYQLVNHNQCEQNYYFALRLHLGQKLFDAAAAQASGGVTMPLAAGDGLHVLQVTSNSPPVAESFDDARDRLVDDYRSYRETRVSTGTMDFLRRRAKVLIAPDYSDYQLLRPHR
ncbi:MAG: peptidyl-prolyl cis-trans isomerase [Steroidobacteraceae bacterium]